MKNDKIIQNCNLIRPRSTTSEQQHQNMKIHRKSRSIFLMSLIGACVFLIVLCVCLITSLVLVGRNLSYGGNTRSSRSLYFSNNNNNSENNLNKNNQIYKLNFNQYLLKTTNNNQNQSNSDINIEQTTTEDGTANKSVVMACKDLKKLTFRLSKDIIPKYYNLFLHPNLQTQTFSGKVAINLHVNKPTDIIAIHSKKLTITETTLSQQQEILGKISGVDGSANTNISIKNTYECPEYEYWVTELDKSIDIGNYTLGLTFNGSLANRIVGFYESSYKRNNETRYIATSKFEPTYARQAFPCFDEPDMKARFKISLGVPKLENYTALSNMNQEYIEDMIDYDIYHFNESVPMSTYLACFIVSDFQGDTSPVNNLDAGTFGYTVYATPTQQEKIQFALDTGRRIIEHYIQYFNIPYPLPKLDMVAIPDFVSGAMEHWGLVTFRETALLYDENESSTTNRQRVATVIAHELAHMWFGNLVTMKWWNDLWLNEGFASYIEYKGVHHVYDTWGMLDQFLIDDLHAVLSLDATLASHPIVQTVENPDQITEIFDTITYSKGASIIRMLEHFVGADHFQNSVTSYLNIHKYDNAVTDDLLTEIARNYDGADVKHVMDTWTKQMGFPVVDVTFNDNMYTLTQKRFFSNPESAQNQTPSEYGYKWHIPITYITSDDNTEQLIWFPDDKDEITISGNFNWIKFNVNQVGYYRVNYPEAIWNALIDALKANYNSMSISDRAHLINDAFSLAEAGQLSYTIPLNLLEYLDQETEFVPWSVAATKLIELKNLMSSIDHADYNRLLNRINTLLTTVVNTVTWEVDADEHLKNHLRTVVLDTACQMSMSECLTQARTQFNQWIDNQQTVLKPKPDLRTIIYYYGIQESTIDKWEQLWQLFVQEQDASEKLKLMRGLSAIKDRDILQTFINRAWDESNVRRQDYFTCLQYIADNPIGESIVWDYVRNNWENLVERFTINERYLGRMIPAITKRFQTQIKLDEMLTFFDKYPEAGAGTAARIEALERVRYNIKWLQENVPIIMDWINT